MDAEQFEQVTGCKPEQDDLERANCAEVGLEGHYHCGLCGFCGWPRFIVNPACTQRKDGEEWRGEGRLK